MQGWNHRYFVLCNGKLSYYKTEKLVSIEQCSILTFSAVLKLYNVACMTFLAS